MRPILIGAGRGSRLKNRTDEIPKTLVEVMGKPMLEHILDSLAQAGFQRKDVLFIGGYRIDVLRDRYPEFTYVENADWQNNNILLSLLTAREHLKEGFLCSYTDIVYTGEVVEGLVASKHDRVLGCDTEWRRRYVNRSQHPETDAEKMRAEGDRVVELSRHIASERAAGEFIGVAKFTADGAATVMEAFDRARAKYAGGPYREGRTFEKAYLIDLFQDMLEQGTSFHRVDTPGGYMELDTLEDLEHAEGWWKRT
jgi:L-glutamine-phosphate cytidylyltransferase